MGYVKKVTDKNGRLRGKRPWLAVIELPRDPAALGVRRSATRAYSTRREAAAALATWEEAKMRGDIACIIGDTRQAVNAGGAEEGRTVEDELDAPSTVDPSTWTVADLLRHWLDDHAAPHVQPRTLYLYRDTIERRLIPALGPVPLADLTPPRIQAAYTRLRRQGASDRALVECHQRLSQALSMAERQDIIARNPAARVTKPTYRPTERHAWTEEQARRVLATALAPDASSYGPVWAVLLTTGLRRSELLGLRWQDVDLVEGRLRVRVARKKGAGEALMEGAPKSAKGRRELGLSPAIVATLRAHKIVQAEERLRWGDAARPQARGHAYTDQGLVFASGAGTPPEPSNLRRDYRRLIERAGVPVITIHDARHTFASLALAVGENIKAISEALGHADVAVTLRTYAHVTAAQQAAVSTRMGERLMAESDAETEHKQGEA